VKIIHYLASCALQFWSNLNELFVCIVVNMTCTISRFQDGGSFQLNPFMSCNMFVVLHMIACCAMVRYIQTTIVCFWTKHFYPGNVYKNQLSRQTESRNLTGPKTLPTILRSNMKIVTKYQSSAINGYL
jgi:hypothetical protein